MLLRTYTKVVDAWQQRSVIPMQGRSLGRVEHVDRHSHFGLVIHDGRELEPVVQVIISANCLMNVAEGVEPKLKSRMYKGFVLMMRGTGPDKFFPRWVVI